MRQEWKPFPVKIPRLCPFSWLGPRFSSLPGFRGMPRLPVFRSFTSRPTAGIRKIENGASRVNRAIEYGDAPRIEFPTALYYFLRRGYSPRIYFFFFLFLFFLFSSPSFSSSLFIGDREIVTRRILTYWDSPPFPSQIRRESIFSLEWNTHSVSGRYLLTLPPPLRELPRENGSRENQGCIRDVPLYIYIYIVSCLFSLISFINWSRSN